MTRILVPISLRAGRLLCLPFLVALALALPATAYAQLPIYGVSNPAVGERYNLEVGVGIWNPSPKITIASTGLALIGTEVDAVDDLGIKRQRFPEFRVALRPAKKHKIRFEYLPIKYTPESVLQRTIVFQDVSYQIGLSINSVLDWKVYRFGYEYDFIYRDRGFVGVIADVRYTDLRASIVSQVASASAQVRTPIPTVGGIARGYLARNFSVTGEITAFKLPERTESTYTVKYVDIDVYGTFNFTDNFGVQGGYRSTDATFRVEADSGTLTVRGLYGRGVVRF